MGKDLANLHVIKTLWGIDDPISPELFQSLQKEGYHGVEVIRLAWLNDADRAKLIQSLNESKLAVVCQVHTCGGYLTEKYEYIYCEAYDVAKHKEDFKKQMRECYDLINEVTAGGFINVHAGVDAWSNEEAITFLEFCLTEIQNKFPNIPVTFETHRQRLFGNPFQTRELLSLLPAIESRLGSTLKLNADLSHWYCACERVFNSKEERDHWWPNLLTSISERCHYIHARFGWAQGPQMADPSAAECESDVELQKSVWMTLMKAQQKNRSGFEVFVCPEYGPAPYMTVHPHTQEPIASLSNAVSYTKGVIEDLYETDVMTERG